MANRRTNNGYYTFHKRPTLLTAKFTVLSTNPAGCTGFALSTSPATFGQPDPSVTTFGRGIASVTMNSSSPATGNNFLTGQIGIQLQDNYSQYLGHTWSTSAGVTGSNILVSTGFTIGTYYQITALGTSTTANWQTVGVPAGVTPVVGLVFQASTSSAGTGSGTAKALTSANFTELEIAGDPNYTLNPVGQASGFAGGSGGWLYFSVYRTTTLVAPPDNTVMWINMLLNSP